MKGTYVLLIKLDNDKIIQIGKLGKIFFKKGYYAYIGSALNGLEQRINRHLRENKKTHWHIDYFLKHGKIISVYYRENSIREECNIAKKIDKKLSSTPGFGCSDCNCNSHLFYGFEKEIITVIKNLNLKTYTL